MDSFSACKRLLPAFAPLAQQCLTSTALNSCGGILEILKTRSSAVDSDGSKECDRFKLGIPYCGTRIEWEVIFDRNHPAHPPDIIFSEQDEELDFAPNVEQLESLVKWNSRDDKALSALLEELMVEYRKHHLKILSQHQRYHFELSSLAQSEKYPEVYVLCRMTEAHDTEPEVRFYIPLQVDFATVPSYLTKNNPGPNSASLLIIFRPPDASRVIPELYLSPRVERALGGSKTLRIPAWGGENGSCLIDYVPAVHKMLENKVESITQSYVQRKEYVAAMLSIFGASVLEYNTENFKSIAFLFEYQGFSFITQVKMTDQYPSAPPTVTMCSIYHRMRTTPATPCQSEIQNYPYSPRWTVDEKLERLRAFLVQMIPQFMEWTKAKGECL